jgi:hypothetical protein
MILESGPQIGSGLPGGGQACANPPSAPGPATAANHDNRHHDFSSPGPGPEVRVEVTFVFCPSHDCYISTFAGQNHESLCILREIPMVPALGPGHPGHSGSGWQSPSR